MRLFCNIGIRRRSKSQIPKLFKHNVPFFTAITVTCVVTLVYLDVIALNYWSGTNVPAHNDIYKVFSYQTGLSSKSDESCSEHTVGLHLILPPIVTSLSDWSFNTTVNCPPFVINKYPTTRQKVVLECKGNSGRLVKASMNSSQDIFVVEFGNKCLEDAIKKCCSGFQPVPNVVHYVWFYTAEMGFFHFLSLMSAFRFIKPCLILIHGPAIPTGKYWDYFVSVSPNIIHVKRDRPTTIFGRKFAFKTHSSDVMRIEALQNYGGIYLDFDQVVLRSLEPLRQYPYTQGLEDPYALGSQVILATSNAPFLRHWYAGYETDYRDHWSWNALDYPFKLTKMYPNLIHVEGYNFTKPNFEERKKIHKRNYDWSTNYGMHMFERYIGNEINLEIIRRLNTTVGSVSRHILFGNKELCQM